MKIPFVEDFGKAFLPKKIRPKMHTYLERAGIFKSPYELIGYLFYISIFISFSVIFVFVLPYINFLVQDMSAGIRTLTVLVTSFLSTTFMLLFLMSFFFLVGYFFIDIRVYKRTHEIERVLPDFLAVVSTNLKGGMHIDAALWNSINAQFGVLSEEITLVSKKVMTGYDVSEALLELHDKYNSPELKRTFSLILSELEVGGKMSKIIDDIVEQLKQTRKLKARMVASVISYIIFIGSITIFIAPGLFALSYTLISFIHGFVITITAGSGAGASSLPSFLSNLDPNAIKPEVFKVFGFVATATVSIFSSMIVAIIEKGDVRGGIKYIPIFLAGSLINYSLCLYGLSFFLNGVSI